VRMKHSFVTSQHFYQEKRQDKVPNKEVLIRCGDAQFAGMNTMRQNKESLLNNCLRTGPARYAARRRTHLKRYLKEQEERAMAFNRQQHKKYPNIEVYARCFKYYFPCPPGQGYTAGINR